MTDEKNKLPEIPTGAAETIIQAAANISGKQPADLDLQQAIAILGGDNPNPIINSTLNSTAEQATGKLFDALTEEDAAALVNASENGMLREIMGALSETIALNLTQQANNETAAETFPPLSAATDQPEPGREALTSIADYFRALPNEETVLPNDEELERIQNQMTEAMQSLQPLIVNAFQNATTTLSTVFEAAQSLTAGRSEYFDHIQSVIEVFARNLPAIMAETLPAIIAVKEEITALTPYLKEELKKPEYEGMTLNELIAITDADINGLPDESSLLAKALIAARAARKADAEKNQLPRTAIKRADLIEYPLDKINSIVWNLLEKDTKGQIAFNMAKSGSKEQAPAYYAINFDALSNTQGMTITKRLLPFDKRVYIATAALFNAGNTTITLSQIYYAMGYTGRPGANDLTRINDSITKMTTARIFVDNAQEAAKYKKRDLFKYDGSLLPLERGTAIVNGQLADAAIHIFREPPLITFAKQRQQITTLDVKLLQSPISKTDANLQIDDYLIERISREKNKKTRSCRILLKTLYEHTGMTDKKQKQRAPEKIKKYLTYYQQQRFIKSFTIESDGITIGL